MNLVEAVNILDGNAYIVKQTETEYTSSLEFDSIYNKKCVENNLDELFENASEKYGVDVNLLKAVGFVESSFRADAVSKSGAMGVMQLMPYTAEEYGVDDPYDAEQNIEGGAKLLRDLLEKYDGNITLCVAAYNAGSGAVDRSGGVPDIEQTVNYVKKINDVLGGALDNDSWTIEGSEPTLSGAALTDIGHKVGKSYNEVVLGSVYAGMIYPSTSAVKSSDIITYGKLVDGSAYEHYVINSGNRYIISGAEQEEE